MRKNLSARSVGFIQGYRSGLEEAVSGQLVEDGREFHYEKLEIPYAQPAKPRRYTPDFVLWNGIVVETKGRFVTADRQKHLLVKAQYPDLDLRFVFSNSKSRISKQSKTTYAKWCGSKGFLWADRWIPEEWLDEPAGAVRLRAVMEIRRKS